MRNYKKVFGIVLCLMAVSMMVFATTAAAAGKNISVTGVLEQKDGAMILKTAKTSYTLTGEVAKDLIGKKIKATGLEEKDAAGKITLKVAKTAAVK